MNLILSRPTVLLSSTAAKLDDGGRLVWPATVNGRRVLLHRWQTAPLHVAELIAAVNLRNSLGVADGDPVEVCIDGRHIGSMDARQRVGWASLWRGREDWYYRHDRYERRARPWSYRFRVLQHGS